MKERISHNVRHSLFFLLLFCFAAAILGDSTSEALLLAHFGASIIPRMFLVNAGALFLLSAGLLSFVDRTDRRRFFFNALLVHGGILLLLRMAVAAHWEFLFFPLFSYAYSSKILFFLLFWTVANDLIDSRSAGREFPYIAAGGTIGAIGVSFAIPGLMKFFAVDDLLVIWALLTFCAGLLLVPLRRSFRYAPRQQRTRSVGRFPGKKRFSALELLRDEPLLRSMSLLYFLIFFLLLNQHITFYHEVKNAFHSASAIASFLGKFNGISMLTTCFLQVSLAGVLMRRLGSTRSMLLLPGALFLVFLLLAVTGGFSIGGARLLFWSVILGMGIRIAFFDAFFSPNFQLFFSSLPGEVRGRGKLLIEGIVKPVAMVVAGSWLLWVVPQLNFRVQILLMTCTAAVALVQTLRLKNAYTKTLTRYLKGFSSNRKAVLQQLSFSGDEDVWTFLARKLEEESFEVQQFLVELIATSKDKRAFSLLLDFLPRSTGKFKATIVTALGHFTEAQVAEELKKCLSSDDPRVVANAIVALSQCGASNPESYLAPLSGHADSRVKANVIMALWPSVRRMEREKLYTRLRDMLFSGSVDDCASALFVTGELEHQKTLELLVEFCEKSISTVFQNKTVGDQAVAALGKKMEPVTLLMLLRLTQHCSRRRCETIIATIELMLPYIDERYWLKGFTEGNELYRNSLLRAMYRMEAEISHETERVFRSVLVSELESITEERQSLDILSKSGSDRVSLLSCAVREELVEVRLNNLLLMLARLDSSGAIQSVVPRLYHTDAHVRACALEVMENTGDVKINRSVIAIMEWLEKMTLLSGAVNGAVSERAAAVARRYTASRNSWVATCAEYACPNG